MKSYLHIAPALIIIIPNAHTLPLLLLFYYSTMKKTKKILFYFEDIAYMICKYSI